MMMMMIDGPRVILVSPSWWWFWPPSPSARICPTQARPEVTSALCIVTIFSCRKYDWEYTTQQQYFVQSIKRLHTGDFVTCCVPSVYREDTMTSRTDCTAAAAAATRPEAESGGRGHVTSMQCTLHVYVYKIHTTEAMWLPHITYTYTAHYTT